MTRRFHLDWCRQSFDLGYWHFRMLTPLLTLPWPFKRNPHGGLGPLRWAVLIESREDS